MIRKNLKRGTTALNFAKPISFYMIRNVLNETNVTCVTKLLRAYVKIYFTVNVNRRNLLVTKLVSGKICNITFTPV